MASADLAKLADALLEITNSKVDAIALYGFKGLQQLLGPENLQVLSSGPWGQPSRPSRFPRTLRRRASACQPCACKY